MNSAEFLWAAIPAGTILAVIVGVYRFYRNHTLNIVLYKGATDSYCYVHDSERNESTGKSQYYAVLKATVDISAGSSLGLENVYFVLKDAGRRTIVDYSAPSAPDNVIKHFNAFSKGWKSNEAYNDKGHNEHWIAQGVAARSSPFTNRPEGGYRVDMIVVLKRFTVLVPSSFACMNSHSSTGNLSTISSEASVTERSGKTVDPIALSDQEDKARPEKNKLHRLQYAILDFDFLPRLSLAKVLLIKKE